MNGTEMSGVIEGGWGYVASAWAISFVLLLAYTLFTVARLKRAEQKKKEG